MKNKMKKISILLCNILLPFNLTGCLTIHDEIRSNNDFRYAIIRQTNTFERLSEPYIIIIGFNYKERIDIPKEIDGYPVTQIGRLPGGFLSFTTSYYVTFPNILKKLFFWDNITIIENIAIEPEIEVEGVFCTHELPHYSFGVFKRLYVYKDVYESKYDLMPGEVDPKGNSFEPSNYPANITFMNNYPITNDDEKYYRLDNVEKNEKLTEPPEPELEGYTFTGWYTEEECIYKYDFDTTLDIELGDEMVLYAGWKANA